METTLDAAKTLSELLHSGTTMMVGTKSTMGRFDSRPLTVADVSDDTIRILVDGSSDWASQVTNDEYAHVTVSDNRDNIWVSLNATMTLTDDDAEIDELWNPLAAAYFDNGRESENISVLHLHVHKGSYWSTSSGRIGSVISMIKAKFGDAGNSGEHGPVTLP